MLQNLCMKCCFMSRMFLCVKNAYKLNVHTFSENTVACFSLDQAKCFHSAVLLRVLFSKREDMDCPQVSYFCFFLGDTCRNIIGSKVYQRL